MLSLNRGRALAALVLTLAALLAVTPTLTASAKTDAAAAGKKCKKAKKKGCAKKKKKKATSKLPGPGTFLTSEHVRVSVGLQYPGKKLIVGVQMFGLTANCSEGGTQIVGGGVTIPLKNAHFSGRKDYPEGNFAEASGSFVGTTKATGTVQIGNVPVPGKGVCDTGKVSFTVKKP